MMVRPIAWNRWPVDEFIDATARSEREAEIVKGRERVPAQSRCGRCVAWLEAIGFGDLRLDQTPVRRRNVPPRRAQAERS